MDTRKGMIKPANIFNLLKSYIECTKTPLYIQLTQNNSDPDLSQVYGIMGCFIDSTKEDADTTESAWVIDEQRFSELEYGICSFVEQFIDDGVDEAASALEHCAVHLMEYLAQETFRALARENYLRSLRYAKAFEKQFDSLLENIGETYADNSLAVYLVNSIPYIEDLCCEHGYAWAV